MRSKFIDLNCLCLKWGKAIFVIPFTFWTWIISFMKKSLAIPFWAWIIYLMKKSRLESHPTLGGKRKFQWEKRKSREKAKKGIKAQETQMLGGMPKSLEKKVTSKIKWVCPSKAIKKKKQQIKEERQKKYEWRQESNCW